MSAKSIEIDTIAGSVTAPKSAASLGNGKTTLSEDEINRMVAETAYFRALQRGFAPGGEIADWLEAEREVRGACEASRLGKRPDDAVVRHPDARPEVVAAQPSAIAGPR